MLRVLVLAGGLTAALGLEGTAGLRGRAPKPHRHHAVHHEAHRVRHGRRAGRAGRAASSRRTSAAAESARFKEGRARAAPHHKHRRGHHHGSRLGAKGRGLDPFYAKLAAASSLLEVASAEANSPMLGANNAGGAALQARSNDPNAGALAQLTKAAETIEMRFKKAEGDKQFGQGLDKSLVNNVERDSETFWDDVKGLTPADTEGLNDEDAQDLQKVVQQVAQMDDDLDDPKRTDKVPGEYDTIRAELQDVDV